MEDQLGLKTDKIFISGDSAGGNLTLAVTNMAIKKGIRHPDFVMPTYPALRISMKNFSPSMFLSFDDPVLPSGFLKMCLESYCEDANGDKDYFLSPALTPDNILKNYPPVRILTAGNDPLRDE